MITHSSAYWHFLNLSKVRLKIVCTQLMQWRNNDRLRAIGVQQTWVTNLSYTTYDEQTCRKNYNNTATGWVLARKIILKKPKRIFKRDSRWPTNKYYRCSIKSYGSMENFLWKALYEKTFWPLPDTEKDSWNVRCTESVLHIRKDIIKCRKIYYFL